MEVQSLLFSRAEGWTTSKAKQWAKSHGYKHGKVDVTDQYIRLRQFDPEGSQGQANEDIRPWHQGHSRA